MTGPDPLTALAAEVDALSRRLTQVGAELRTLRRTTTPAPTPEATTTAVTAAEPIAPTPEHAVGQAVGAATPAQPQAQPQPQLTAAGQVPPAPHHPFPQPPFPQYQPYAPPPRVSLAERLGQDGAGSRLLAWVGGAVTTLGVVMLLVLAVQRGYLGPVPRVVGGALLGAALVGLALRLNRKPDNRTGALAVAATGFAVLYLDVVATTALYGYFPTWLGLLSGLLVAGAGLWLAVRWDEAVLAVGVVLACPVCAPVITGVLAVELVLFLLVLQLVAAPVHLLRSWPVLAVAAGLPPALGALPVLTASGAATSTWLSVAVAVVGLAVAVVSARRTGGNPGLVALLATAPAPVLVAALLLPDGRGELLAGGLAAVLLGLWVVLRRTGKPEFGGAFSTALAAMGLLAAFEATALVSGLRSFGPAVLAESAVLAVLAGRTRSRGALVGALAFGVPGLLAALGETLEVSLLLGSFARATPTDLVAGVFTALALAAAAVAVTWAATRAGAMPSGPNSWIAAGALVLYSTTGLVVCAALLVSPTVTAFLFGHALVTVAWAVAALVLLNRGVDSAPLRVSGLVLVGAALVKLVLFDLSALNGFARVLAFLGAGLVLLAAGTRYAKLVAAKKKSANS
ncbi:DUF2339 domain-containing protein [Actinosynnema pretiosum]|uniref:DUF2339 domain-containing protein n=1 Tax=Actinosynnema pretiosum TaxID=42197 RepID=A0A290ZFT4_9PSEU|nr:DUF2339 domain-containing protein [Actinosynnema pretiosum]ATE57867.1 hypothetical protein CNX65_34930 [Actinosynnema pretiosum]